MWRKGTWRLLTTLLICIFFISFIIMNLNVNGFDITYSCHTFFIQIHTLKDLIQVTTVLSNERRSSSTYTSEHTLETVIKNTLKFFILFHLSRIRFKECWMTVWHESNISYHLNQFVSPVEICYRILYDIEWISTKYILQFIWWRNQIFNKFTVHNSTWHLRFISNTLLPIMILHHWCSKRYITFVW